MSVVKAESGMSVSNNGVKPIDPLHPQRTTTTAFDRLCNYYLTLLQDEAYR